VSSNLTPGTSDVITMNVEKWGKQPIREVSRKPDLEAVLPGAGQEHMEPAPKSSSEAGEVVLLEKVIEEGPDREALIKTLQILLDSTGVQESWIEDLAPEARQKMNDLVRSYFEVHNRQALTAEEMQKRLQDQIAIKRQFEKLFI
jgi:hypothetical protein